MNQPEPQPEYLSLVAALPKEWEPDLLVSPNVPTAFYRCVRVGHQPATLIADAQALVARGGGVGAMVRRFETLAQNPPVRRDDAPAGPRITKHVESECCGWPHPRNWSQATCFHCGYGAGEGEVLRFTESPMPIRAAR